MYAFKNTHENYTYSSILLFSVNNVSHRDFSIFPPTDLLPTLYEGIYLIRPWWRMLRLFLVFF